MPSAALKPKAKPKGYSVTKVRDSLIDKIDDSDCDLTSLLKKARKYWAFDTMPSGADKSSFVVDGGALTKIQINFLRAR